MKCWKTTKTVIHPLFFISNTIVPSIYLMLLKFHGLWAPLKERPWFKRSWVLCKMQSILWSWIPLVNFYEDNDRLADKGYLFLSYTPSKQYKSWRTNWYNENVQCHDDTLYLFMKTLNFYGKAIWDKKTIAGYGDCTPFNYTAFG